MPDTPDEELVRRLLADARHDEPMPADVAARLDRVLEELAAEERRPDGAVPRRRQHSVRRRRRWAVGLAAAASVAAVVAVAPHGSFTSGDGADSNGSSAGGTSAGDEAAVAGRAPELHRDTLAADVRRVTRRLRAPGAGLAAPSAAAGSLPCATADWGAGTTTPVRLDGVPAMLVLRPPADGRRVADVLECGTARVLASVALPAR